MKYYIGLIPDKPSYLKIQKLREVIIQNHRIDDYRSNPIFHVTLSYLLADNLQEIVETIKTKNLQLEPITLNIESFVRWDDNKVALILDNKNISSLINELELLTTKYNINYKYRRQVEIFYLDNDEHIGDHLKVIRNVDLEKWKQIEKDSSISFPKEITFDRIAIFNADYSEINYL